MDIRRLMIHRYIEDDGTVREPEVRVIELDGETAIVENIETGERYDCFTNDLRKVKK